MRWEALRQRDLIHQYAAARSEKRVASKRHLRINRRKTENERDIRHSTGYRPPSHTVLLKEVL